MLDDMTGRHPLRIVLAEDAVLLREGSAYTAEGAKLSLDPDSEGRVAAVLTYLRGTG